MRAAVIHVMADAAVSVLVIVGLLLARVFGWLWMDPLAGIVGALVIASWSCGLIRDTSTILLDMNPDRRLTDAVREEIEREGDRIADLHLSGAWGRGISGLLSCPWSRHSARDADFYRARLSRFPSVSHLTIEVHGT